MSGNPDRKHVELNEKACLVWKGGRVHEYAILRNRSACTLDPVQHRVSHVSWREISTKV